jgi:hypothetical protein
MNVVSDKKTLLNALVSIQDIGGAYGLVLESRGGARGKPNERNTDYTEALTTILNRLAKLAVGQTSFYLVSTKALEIWTQEERSLEVFGADSVNLSSLIVADVVRELSRSIKNKKEDPNSRGGNSTKRILIECSLKKSDWLKVVHGEATSSLPISEHEVEVEAESEAAETTFDPADTTEAREKVKRAISLRRGQPKFRKALIKAYNGQCAVTSTPIESILEAAHIVPYQGAKTNHVTNGLLLRADIHTLYDLGLLAISEHYMIHIDETLRSTEYGPLHKQIINLPKNKAKHPSKAALKTRPLPRGAH